jgi:hypothetical protein
MPQPHFLLVPPMRLPELQPESKQLKMMAQPNNIKIGLFIGIILTNLNYFVEKKVFRETTKF